MFRLSHFLQELRQPTPLPRSEPAGPVVIWNLVRRCNLTCKHCYAISADKDFTGELSTAEIYRVMDDLKAFRVPALILSGGEPLLHPDIFDIARRAKDMGFFVALSSNGTLIDERTADAIADVDFDYVGISLDGLSATHDHFRRKDGAFDASLNGIRLCSARGVKVGIRFTLVQENAADFPSMLQLLEDENLDKFYLSHLNYAGRGNKNRKGDAYFTTTRRAVKLLIETNWRLLEQGISKQFVTGNNDADSVLLLRWVEEHFPQEAPRLRKKLAQWGGNASGTQVANIDNLGIVHPDTFWWSHALGNVRERPFSHIWQDLSDPLMAGLKARPRKIKGRCSHCAYFDICGGNTRTRALQLTGDPWQEDPGCYLTDEEIGITAGAQEDTPAPIIR